MQRRPLLIALLAAPVTAAHAHHGWSGFDQDRPLFLQGTARKVAWRNPHAEFDLEMPADLALPADLAKRQVPAQIGERRRPAPARRRAPADAQGPPSGTSSLRP